MNVLSPDFFTGNRVCKPMTLICCENEFDSDQSVWLVSKEGAVLLSKRHINKVFNINGLDENIEIEKAGWEIDYPTWGIDYPI